jgi:integrase
MGVLVRKRDGCWWVFVAHKGQRKAKKVGDKEAAKAVARKIQTALAAGDLQLDRPDVPLFKDYAEAWLKEYPRVKGVKESTAEQYERHLKTYLLPAFGDQPLTAITRAAVKAFVARLLETGSVRQAEQGLAPRTVQLSIATLRLVLGEAVDAGLLRSNPASGVGKWNRRRTEAEAEGCDPFAAKELEAIAAAAREHVPMLWPLVGLWALTGMRAGEVFGLRLKDLDLEAGTAVVRRSLSRGRLGSPKTGKARVVSICHPLLERPEAVLEALRALRSVREAEAAVAGRDLDPEGYVFLRASGQPHRSIAELWKRCLTLAGVRYRNPEQLRHTFASTLLSRGVSLLYVQRQGGWANANVLLTHYSRWLPQEAPAQMQPSATPVQPRA